MATGLATRCPACGTVFRVVPDQLRVSEGWVRCGRCSEVFNATQSLVDLDAAAVRKTPASTAPPPPAPPEPPAPSPAPAPLSAPPPAQPPAPAAASAVAAPALAETPAAPDHAAVPPAEPEADAWSPPVAEFGALEAAGARDDDRSATDFDLALPAAAGDDDRREPAFDLGPVAPEHGEAAAPAPGQAATPAQHPASIEPSADTIVLAAAAAADTDGTDLAAAAAPAPDAVAVVAAAKPEFLRRAERAERWRRPWVRALLGLGVLLGLGGLAGQVLHEYRDLAAARYPQLRPLLEQGCAWLDCRVGAARAIDSLAVESSGLVRVEDSDLYRLSVVLRNRSGIPLALPALDLALTDRQGRLIARKVLRAGELGAAGETLAAGAETTLAGTLRTGNGPVAGYTVELFYP